MTRKDAFSLRLHAYADGELDDTEMKAVEAHLSTCADCQAELEAIRALKAALHGLDFSEVAPDGLAADIQRRVASARNRRVWAAGGGLLAACLAGALLLMRPVSPIDDLVKSHRQTLSLAAVEIALPDHDKIKPWLRADLSFAPPVLEKAAGCTLVGARTERLARQAASDLIYSCEGQKVDFYAVADRQPDAPLTLPRAVKARDYHVVTWQRGQLTCYAVSDAPTPRLLALASYIQSHAAEG